MIGASLGRAKIKEVFLCILTKHCNAKSAGGTSNSLHRSKSSTHRRVLPTNQVVAQNVAPHARLKWATAVFNLNARCTQQFAPPAGKRLPCRSNRAEIGRFTAENATSHNLVEVAGKDAIQDSLGSQGVFYLKDPYF